MVNQQTDPSDFYKAYSGAVADKNLLTEPPSRRPSRGIIPGTTGALTVTRLDGTNVTFPALLAGVCYPIQAIALVASGSTVTGVSVLW